RGAPRHAVAFDRRAAAPCERVRKRHRLASPARLPLLQAHMARLTSAKTEAAVAGLARPAEGRPVAGGIWPQLPVSVVRGLELPNNDSGPPQHANPRHRPRWGRLDEHHHAVAGRDQMLPEGAEEPARLHGHALPAPGLHVQAVEGIDVLRRAADPGPQSAPLGLPEPAPVGLVEVPTPRLG